MTNFLFDYDGTLHNSIKIYAPAFRTAYTYLIENGFADSKEFTDQEISYWLGFTADDMWKIFLPNLPEEEKKKCSAMIGKEMIRLVNNGMAELYPQAENILQKLKDLGYNLIFLSNCKRAYMEANIRQFRLDRFFSAFYCSEDFGFIPKHEIFITIKENCSGDYIVIGDRFQDMEISEMHNLQSIGCFYGYGSSNELQHATYRINNLSDILLFF
ncbi:HAD family hydrolase [Anaerocolumna sp. MB42-C2]|uniref:HAD family hydrolase n=1 Tax=Anaerocolumna sp. MB42-C2 TaxID=3070997 RepID=UPI0027E1019A|nr:HAD-IA family hydrolase [Anaerocolumna sp. MB42-C2]WMJ88522.1 HAD-IA family hydrolase [Anaerocolumna sp. MB42-C2]